MRILTIVIFIGLSLVICFKADTRDTKRTFKHHVEKNVYLEKSEPITGFTFNELVKLSEEAEPEGDIKIKLNNHLSMVFIVNRNFKDNLDKSFIKVAEWNIKRGFNVEAIKGILTNPDRYKVKYLSNVRKSERKNLLGEANDFANADIYCFSEVDIGMPRTKYKNIVQEIADTLGWNYAYATEFVEVGPLFQKQKVDKERYRGLHGNVIISRYPIISGEVIRLPGYYDWYREEVKEHESPLEHFRKFGAKSIFSEKIEHREVRHGGRQALIVDIQLPNNQIITVVSTHLEDRAYADERYKQFKYLLEKLKDKKTPVILAGDLNTSTTDTKPTSLKKEVYKRIRDPHFLLRQAAFVPIPFIPVVGGLALVTVSKLLQYKDPIFPSIPVIFPNHERKFFTYLKKFQFNDGNTFDISGDKNKSFNGKSGLLANSNQRHWKGFKSTYKLEKPRVIAYFKLDWFFIKPVGEHFRPFNGRTLKTLNYSISGHISDHNPITVDIRL